METLQMYIGGEWVDSLTGQTFEATNPATQEVIAHLQEGGREDARRAIEAANRARPVAARMSVWERSKMCFRLAEAIERHAEELAQVLTRDQGKPLHGEARFEVSKAAEGFRYAGEQVKWLETSVIPVEAASKRVFSIRQPRGVYAIVTPWNFPYNIPVEYMAPGLAAGNTIVWVPAPTTSVCAVKLMKVLEEADVPPGFINLVTGPGPVVGDEIVGHPDTHAVGFTGSPETGRKIAQRAACKPCLLELGDNGPTVILDDADLGPAASATALGCWLNAGQICCATERILVHERVRDQVVEGLVKSANGVVLGDPTRAETTMGPLNNEPTAHKNDGHIADALEKGARLLAGGSRQPKLGSPLFYQPTVLVDCKPEMLVNHEESFGPLAPVFTVGDDEEALRLANQCDLGLVSAVFTRDLNRAFKFSERLQTGIVMVNEFTDYWELHIPFGGASGKRSGVGRIGGRQALLEMTDLKTICFEVGTL